MATGDYHYDISLRLNFVAGLYAINTRKEYLAGLIDCLQTLEVDG